MQAIVSRVRNIRAPERLTKTGSVSLAKMLPKDTNIKSARGSVNNDGTKNIRHASHANHI